MSDMDRDVPGSGTGQDQVQYGGMTIGESQRISGQDAEWRQKQEQQSDARSKRIGSFGTGHAHLEDPAPEAMPAPDLTPDRYGRLSDRQEAEKFLHYQFYMAALWMKDAASPDPLDMNDPVQKAMIRRNFTPEQLKLHDEVDALLSKPYTLPTNIDTSARADMDIFAGSPTMGSEHEKSFYHDVVENCSFTINGSSQCGTLGVALSNHRILLVFKKNSSKCFDTYSLCWEDIRSSKMTNGDSDNAILKIRLESQKGVRRYIVDGDQSAVSAIDELITFFFKTWAEEYEKEQRRKALPLVTRGLLSVFDRLFK